MTLSIFYTSIPASISTTTSIETAFGEFNTAVYRLLRGYTTNGNYAFAAPQFEIQGSDPASPPSSHVSLYAKSGGLYYKTSAGAVTGPMAFAGPKFRAASSGSLSIPGSTNTKLTVLTTEQLDSDADYDTGTQRFVPGVAGWYLLNVTVEYSGAAASTRYRAGIFKNGSVAIWCDMLASYNSSFFIQATTIQQANGSTDYFEAYTNQNNASSYTVSSCYFEGFMLA